MLDQWGTASVTQLFKSIILKCDAYTAEKLVIYREMTEIPRNLSLNIYIYMF